MPVTDLVFINSTGYHFADYPSFLSFIQGLYLDIYGADTDIDSDTQDGQFLAVLAQMFYDMATIGASNYNSFSPATAQGVGLSRVVKINGIRRGVATNSTVDVLVVGTAGTNIIGGVAIDTLQQKWNLPTPTLIPSSGSILVTATAQLQGALSAAVNTVNTIFTPTLGWQTVNNASAATPGAPVESDAELRVRQTVSTANPSLTVLEGTVGGVSNVLGVTKVRAYENPTNTTDANGLPPHSFSLVVAGGASIDVANEMMLHKTPGTQTYGTTSVPVTDSHGMPITINFFRPTPITIKTQITIAAGTSWSSDFITLMQNNVANAINALLIGDTVLITKLYAPAYLFGSVQGSTYDIVSLEIAKGSGALGTSNITLAFTEQAVVVAASDVTVIVT